jgi:hypothetical protein
VSQETFNHRHLGASMRLGKERAIPPSRSLDARYRVWVPRAGRASGATGYLPIEEMAGFPFRVKGRRSHLSRAA